MSRTFTLCLARNTDRTAFDVSACRTRVAKPSGEVSEEGIR